MFQGSPYVVTESAVDEIRRANGRSSTPPAAPVTVPCALETATPPAGPATSTEKVATSWMPGPLPRSALIDTPGNRLGVMTEPNGLNTGKSDASSSRMLGVV